MVTGRNACIIAGLITMSLLNAYPSMGLTSDYVGTIGKRDIGMTLFTNDDPKQLMSQVKLSGYYFYNQNPRDINLEVECDGKRHISLYELNPSGQRVALFKGTFPEKDPKGRFGKSKLNGEVIIGEWSPLNGSDKQPFYLRETGGVGAGPGENRYAVAGVQDAATLEVQVRKFKDAVLTKNKAVVASFIKYPIWVTFNDQAKEMRNKAEFLKNYDRIFTPRYVAAIGKAVPHNMFVKVEGVMLGSNGEVWFSANGKVQTLNNM